MKNRLPESPTIHMASLRRTGQQVKRAYAPTREHCKQLVETTRNEESSSFQMHVSRSLPLNPQAAAVGIGGTVWTVGTARPKGIVDGVRGKRGAVEAEGVTRRNFPVGHRAVARRWQKDSSQIGC